MKFSRFQGDLAILISERGTRLEFQGGQPVMDQGLHNAVLISLYTKPGYWGNALVTDESKKIGSDVERQRTIVDTQTINDVTDDVEKALKWMQDTKLVNNIEIEVTNPKLDYILIDIKLYPPGQDVQELLVLKHGVNWIAQAINPAHERFSHGL